MTLEEQLRDAAKRGELNYLSIAHTAKGFSATYAPGSTCAHNIVKHADPVEAIRQAIAGWKPTRAPRKTKPDADLDFG